MMANTYQEHIASAEALVTEATKVLTQAVHNDQAGQTFSRMIMRADCLNNIAQSHIMLAQIKTWLDSGERAID